MQSGALKFDEAKGQAFLFLYVQPGAKKTEWAGIHNGRLKVRLAAPPVEGKANKALLAFVAKSLKLAKRDVWLEQGELSRQKTVGLACERLCEGAIRYAVGLSQG